MWLTGSLTQTINFGLTTTPFATNTGIPRIRDSRVGSGTAGIAELRTAPDTSTPASGVIRVLGNTTLPITDGNTVAVLAPGAGLSVVGDIDYFLQVTFFYRERVPEPSELTF